MIKNSRPKCDEVICIRIPIDLVEKISEIADKTDSSVSSIARRALNDFVRRAEVRSKSYQQKKSRRPVKVL